VGFQNLRVERYGASLRITIDREAARNAINPEVMNELIDALQMAKDDEDAACIVITGAGDKAFCAGGDLGGGMASGAVAQHFDRAMLSELFKRMRTLGKPVIARVNGHALGGGFGLALACDLIISADHAEFGTPEINIGLWPYIITSVIQRNLPDKVALELMMLGKRIGAADAKRWGFVNEVVSASELDGAVTRWVEGIAGKSPLILRLGKDSFYAARDMSFDDALAYLQSQLSIGLLAEDAMEGIQAFIQKRPPQWRGR
jgi:enoyl-CoA hydratase